MILTSLSQVLAQNYLMDIFAYALRILILSACAYGAFSVFNSLAKK